jgi:hypothetical protein
MSAMAAPRTLYLGLCDRAYHQRRASSAARLWHEVTDAIGLLVTSAGPHLEGLFRPSLAAGVAVFLKLVLMPVIAAEQTCRVPAA